MKMTIETVDPTLTRIALDGRLDIEGTHAIRNSLLRSRRKACGSASICRRYLSQNVFAFTIKR